MEPSRFVALKSGWFGSGVHLITGHNGNWFVGWGGDSAGCLEVLHSAEPAESSFRITFSAGGGCLFSSTHGGDPYCLQPVPPAELTSLVAAVSNCYSIGALWMLVAAQAWESLRPVLDEMLRLHLDPPAQLQHRGLQALARLARAALEPTDRDAATARAAVVELVVALEVDEVKVAAEMELAAGERRAALGMLTVKELQEAAQQLGASEEELNAATAKESSIDLVIAKEQVDAPPAARLFLVCLLPLTPPLDQAVLPLEVRCGAGRDAARTAMAGLLISELQERALAAGGRAADS
jgi:hypothetical protein